MDARHTYSMLEAGMLSPEQTAGLSPSNRAHMAALWMGNKPGAGSIGSAIRYDSRAEAMEAEAQTDRYVPTLGEIAYFCWSNRRS